MMVFDARLEDKTLISKSVSLSNALSISNEAKFICEAQPPFPVTYVNKKWTELTGFDQEEVIGGNLNGLQGPLTNKDAIVHMIDLLRTKGYCDKQRLINYTKHNKPFCCELSIRPIIVNKDRYYFTDGSLHIGYFLTTVTLLSDQTLPPTVKLGTDFLLPSNSTSMSSSMSNLTDSNDSGSNSSQEEDEYRSSFLT